MKHPTYEAPVNKFLQNRCDKIHQVCLGGMKKDRQNCQISCLVQKEEEEEEKRAFADFPPWCLSESVSSVLAKEFDSDWSLFSLFIYCYHNRKVCCIFYILYYLHRLWPPFSNKMKGPQQNLFFYLFTAGFHRREWACGCRNTHDLARTLIFTGFTWVISTISTCTLNNLYTNTVGYGLPDMLPLSGSCSCVGCLFYDSLFFLFVPPKHQGEHRCPCRLHSLCWRKHECD